MRRYEGALKESLMTQTLVQYLEQRNRALDANEVSELFGMNKDTIYRFAAEGILPSFKVGNALRFDPKELAEYVNVFFPKRGMAHKIAVWLDEQALYRGGPRYLPELLTKVLKEVPYDWLATAAEVSRDPSHDLRRNQLFDDFKKAVSMLTVPEQRELLEQIKTGKYDEPISQHRDLLNEPEPGDDEEVE
jgi:excisionase family DNA binding protein